MCRCDTLLESAHFSCQCRLITNCRGHTSQQSGNLGACLCETEDVVDEQKNVLSLNVTEIFRHGKSRKTYSHSCSGRLIHLTVNKNGLVDNSRLGHFVVKVVALTGTLANTCENGDTAVLVCNVVDKLLDKNGLTDTCASEKTYLTALEVRADKVDYLDACFKHLIGSCLLLVGWCFTVDSPSLLCFGSRLVVNGFSEKIEDPSQSISSDRNGDRCACIYGISASYQSVSGRHCNTSYNVVTDMLRNLAHQLLAVKLNFYRIEKIGQVILFKADINDRSDYLNNLSNIVLRHLNNHSFQFCLHITDSIIVKR